VRTTYWPALMLPSCQAILFDSRSVTGVPERDTSPSLFGFAGVQPVDSCSCTAADAVGPHPLLCIVSADSKTRPSAMNLGVSRVTSSIGGCFPPLSGM